MRRTALRRNKGTPQEPSINITPLIDVVFVILIAFILIAPLLELDRIELASGQHAGSHLPVHFEDSGPIQIHVHMDNSLFLNKQPIAVSELSPLLRQLKSQYPAVRPQLFHHKKAHFGTYQEIKNALEAADFKEMDVVLLP
jgi:biopolymer transport protein ExbD